MARVTVHVTQVSHLTLQFMFPPLLASSFPLNEDEMYHGTTPSCLEPPKSHHTLSAIEQLTFEILVNIVSYCDLPSVLCLSSTSCRL